MLRRIAVFLLALFVTYLFAATAATHSVLTSLASLGVQVTLSQRLEATGHDLAGMAPSFLPLLGVGLLIAFLVTAAITRFVTSWRTPLYMLAGATAIITVHVALKVTLDITPVAAARTMPGLFVQALSGAAGGLVFARLSRKWSAPSPP